MGGLVAAYTAYTPVKHCWVSLAKVANPHIRRHRFSFSLGPSTLRLGPFADPVHTASRTLAWQMQWLGLQTDGLDCQPSMHWRVWYRLVT